MCDDGQDLQAIKIGSQHVYKIWRSLVEYRNCVEAPTTDYLYAAVPACAAGEAPSGRDADPQPAVLCDARPLGRARVLLKDDHNYC